MAYFPVKHPSFSFSSFIRSAVDSLFTFSAKALAPSSYFVPLVSFSTRGCSGAKTRKVTEKMVSGRVVKVLIVWLVFSMGKNISVPWLFPIQFTCIVLTLSAQPFMSSSPFRSSSAYSVILKNHCSSFFSPTAFLHLQHAPSTTCSFAKTVLQSEHQLTGDFFL